MLGLFARVAMPMPAPVPAFDPVLRALGAAICHAGDASAGHEQPAPKPADCEHCPLCAAASSHPVAAPAQPPVAPAPPPVKWARWAWPRSLADPRIPPASGAGAPRAPPAI